MHHLGIQLLAMLVKQARTNKLEMEKTLGFNEIKIRWSIVTEREEVCHL